MAVTTWLIDKSAYARMQTGDVLGVDEWNAQIARGRVRLSTVTRLELGFSARSGRVGREASALPPLSLMPIERLTPAMENRAFEVQMLLADRGQHRAPSIPDLLIAATAELADMTVPALDKDFQLIAKITEQPIEMLDA